MTDDLTRGAPDLPHLIVPGQPSAERFQRRGGGGGERRLYHIPDRGRHAAALRQGLRGALDEQDHLREAWDDVLRSDGIVLAVTGWPGGFEVAVESLELRASGIELLSVRPSSDANPEVATVFIPDGKANIFFRRVDQYEQQASRSGRPRHEDLVANIQGLRRAVLEQLWTEEEALPDGGERRWWELWLRRTGSEVDVLNNVAEHFGWTLATRAVAFPGRTVTAIEARAPEIGQALGTRLPIAELRRPRLAQSPAELGWEPQRRLVADLAARIDPAGPSAPCVCLLDTGLYRHSLLEGSVDPADIRHVVGRDGVDRHGHGTELGGLALFGELEDPLTSALWIRLRHRLESVKVLPDPGAAPNRPDTYAAVTAAGAAAPEAAHPDRRRAFCIANGDLDYHSDGRPTSWSATIDALAFGTDVAPLGSGLQLLSTPDPRASRLMVVSGGNVRDGFTQDFLATCDLSPVQDPSQAWNALTVGAYTEKDGVPADPAFAGWSALARPGELSPLSRTSMSFSKLWPVKPDVVLEGGNLLVSPRATDFDTHDVVSLVITSRREPLGEPLTTTNATSAAAAQAARLAAIASAHYPDLWPESLRGLVVHAAEWTDPMLDAFAAAGANRTRRQRLVRRYGFGVPTLERVMHSASRAVTLIAQATIRPFESVGSDTRLREMHIHELPWPDEQLRTLGDTPVRLRVTLSYFIEPNPSSRGWAGRYVYPSHGLRFDIRRPLETTADFRRRLNRLAEDEEGGHATLVGHEPDWFLGSQQRNAGSLHADLWTGTAADLANCGVLGVYPVGGWWKQNNRRDRVDIPVRYALLVSISAPAVGIDLYTPIAVKIGLPIPIPIET